MIKEEIVKLLNSYNFDFEYLEHEPTPRSEDSARVRGTSMKQGIKALILKGRKTSINYMFCISGDKKLDLKIGDKLVKEPLTFEDPNIIFERYKLEIGGIPPFGELLNLLTFYDNSIFENKEIAFNCGDRISSIIMFSEDYRKLISNDKIIAISK